MRTADEEDDVVLTADEEDDVVRAADEEEDAASWNESSVTSESKTSKSTLSTVSAFASSDWRFLKKRCIFRPAETLGRFDALVVESLAVAEAMLAVAEAMLAVAEAMLARTQSP